MYRRGRKGKKGRIWWISYRDESGRYRLESTIFSATPLLAWAPTYTANMMPQFIRRVHLYIPVRSSYPSLSYVRVLGSSILLAAQ